MLGANDREVIDYLVMRQSPILTIRFYVPPGWHLDILNDGSAELRSWSAASPSVAHVQAGTFDFENLAPSILASCIERDRETLQWYFNRPEREHVQVLLERAGEPHPSTCFFNDWRAAKRLFEEALARAEKDKGFEKQWAERPPFA